MIVSLDSEDYELVTRMFDRYPAALYGLALPFSRDECYVEMLAQGEDLFVCGYGVGSSIGDLQGASCFCAAELADWLKEFVIPWNYAGHIYVSAPRATPTFINDLLRYMGEAYSQRIHGQFESEYGLINPAAKNHWISAAA